MRQQLHLSYPHKILTSRKKRFLLRGKWIHPHWAISALLVSKYNLQLNEQAIMWMAKSFIQFKLCGKIINYELAVSWMGNLGLLYNTKLRNNLHFSHWLLSWLPHLANTWPAVLMQLWSVKHWCHHFILPGVLLIHVVDHVMTSHLLAYIRKFLQLLFVLKRDS
jgi:hypothetical protein